MDTYTVVINESYGGYGLSNKVSEYLKTITGLENPEWELERHDLNLIDAIRKFGKKANGSFASLTLKDIPVGVDYDIQEYDGAESLFLFVRFTEIELKNGLSPEQLNLLKYTRNIRVTYDI